MTLWELPPEENKTIEQEIKEATTEPTHKKETGSRALNIVANGLPNEASPEDWYIAIKWTEYLLKSHTHRLDNYSKSIQNLSSLVSQLSERLGKIEALIEQNGEHNDQ